jgi:hypothetical protein
MQWYIIVNAFKPSGIWPRSAKTALRRCEHTTGKGDLLIIRKKMILSSQYSLLRALTSFGQRSPRLIYLKAQTLRNSQIILKRYLRRR